MSPYTQEIIQAILSLKEAIISLKPSSSALREALSYITAIGAMIAALGVIFGIYKVLREVRNQKKLFIEGQNLKEREDIRYRLNHFFGPLKELRAESRILYAHLALDEKKNYAEQKNGQRWRALRHLSQGKDFSDQDKAILKEILEIGEKQLNLIEKEGWLIDNSTLAELFGMLGAHIRLLTLAAEHKIDGISEKIEAMVFPLEIDGAIETEIKKLQDRYKELLHFSDKEMRWKKLFRKKDETISWYDRNPKKYFRQTAYLDLREIYKEFRKHIPFAGTILDAGCGVGRDTRYFINKGYRVISFDASIEMVNLCRQYSFAYCLHKSFENINYIEEFDGIWASASLHHLSPLKFKDALLRLADATKPGGIIHFSLKTGNGHTIDQGKTTYYHQDKDIDPIMIEKLMFTLIKKWKTEGKKKSDISNWENYIFKKPEIAK
jgi:SAM-dependent methyltransferase